MNASWIEYLVIGVYLAFLFGIGLIFKKLNSGDDDYFRSGCRGSWWLVGMSIFMSGISVATFTSNARLAFEGGWTVSLIYLVNALCFLVCWAFLAARFRQMRLITFPQVIRDRFGVSLQQGFAYFSVVMFLPGGALQLYSLAIFANGIFNLPVVPTILIIGIVVAFYSTAGGNWAVMAADFMQSMVLLPVTILITFLCLHRLDGLSGLFQKIETMGLREDFQLIKSAGAFEGGMFSLPWLASLLLIQILVNLGMVGAPRFFACKDGKAASRAALLCAVLSIFGAAVWFIPPMAARLLYEDQVLASAISQPSEACFAVVARNMLPAGMMGLMMVAMFGASMSTMDTALNKNSAMLVEDIVPALLRRFNRSRPLGPSTALFLGRIFTVAFCIIVTFLAIVFAMMSGVGAFDVGFKINALVTLPSMVPLFLGMFIMRTPRWAGWASFLAGLVPSVVSASFPGLISTHMTGLLCFLMGSAVLLLSMPFWRKSPEAYRINTQKFFERMRTPVDFEREVGQANDTLQLKTLGSICLALSFFIALILIVPNDLTDRLGILFVSGFIALIGLLLFGSGKYHENREKQQILSERSAPGSCPNDKDNAADGDISLDQV